MPLEVCPVSEVFQTVRTLHQLLLEVDGFLVAIRVGFEGEAGGALGAVVTRRQRLRGRGTVEGLVEGEQLGLWRVGELVRLAERTLNARPVQGQRHQREGVVVLVFPEMFQAAEQQFAQGAGEPLWVPGASVWQQSFP